MTISTCVAGLVAEGRIAKGKAAEADRLYAKHFAALKHTMGESAAATEASERTIRALDAQALHRKRQVLLGMKAQADTADRLRAAAGTDAEGRLLPIPKAAAFEEIRAMDREWNGIMNQAHGMIQGILSKFRRDLLGQVRNKAMMANMAREMFGEDTGDAAAREMAEAWRRTAEWLRSRFNAAGGAIAKLDGWGLPTQHSHDLVLAAGRDTWRSAITPLLDRSRMIDWETGLPMTDGALHDLLGEVWGGIATNGWDRRQPGTLGVGALGNRMQEHRVLHFQNADNWMQYMEKFGGKATALDVMQIHIRAMARDIAAMERMGPNPEATLNFTQGMLKKSGAEWLAEGGEMPKVNRWARFFKGTASHQVKANVNGGSAHLQRMFDEYSGKNGISENPRMSLTFGTLSALQVSAKLGSTALKTGGDIGTMLKTAQFDGLPMNRMIAGYIGRVFSQGGEDAAHVARFGVMGEDWTRIMHGDYRLSGEEITSEVAKRMADSLLRVSFLNRLSDAVRKTFAAEMWNTITMERGKAFGELHPDFAAMMQRHGIDAARWDTLRATPLESYKGMDWIYPDRIEDQGVRDAVFAMTHGEVQYALITTDIDTRAAIGMLPRGNVGFELIRSAFLFKQFPLTMMSLHGRRMMQQSTLPAQFGYFAMMMAMTTAGAAFYRQIWNLAMGRDPEDMTRAGFWQRSAFDGGGLSIFGDFIKSSENRFGGGFEQTLVGPLLGSTVANLAKTLHANVGAATDGDPNTQTNWTRDLTNLALRETPGLSLWYTRLAVDRLLIDQIRAWSDPDYQRKIAAAYGRTAQQDTGFWAGPGAVTGGGPPLRAPDLGNAIGMPGAPENVQRVQADAAN